MLIRKISKQDNKVVSDLIKSVFREFKIDKPGTVYTDPTTDNLYELFQQKNSVLWLAEEDDVILGACGVFPTSGLPLGCGELVKFYLSTNARGKGIGSQLLQKTYKSAKEFAYAQLYLESFPELSRAVSIYTRDGFKHLPKPLGNSGHFATTIWMLKEL